VTIASRRDIAHSAPPAMSAWRHAALRPRLHAR
jgi:hypothetical protein